VVTVEQLQLWTLLLVVIFASGCTHQEDSSNSPEIKINPSKHISLEEGETAQLSVWAKNNYNETEGFDIKFEVGGDSDYISVKDSVDGSRKYLYNLGEVKPDSHTTKKVVMLSPNMTRVEEAGVQSVNKTITITAFRHSTTETTDPVATKNTTVAISQS